MRLLLGYLPLLACPIGMGLMMWVMMRGGGQRQPPQPPITPAQQAELARLRAELDELRGSSGDTHGGQQPR